MRIFIRQFKKNNCKLCVSRNSNSTSQSIIFLLFFDSYIANFFPSLQSLKLCLALLHEFHGKFDEAAQLYISMGRPEAFALISSHGLFDLMTRQGMTVELMRLDADRAVKLFIDNIDYCPPEKTVSQLAGSPDLLFEVSENFQLSINYVYYLWPLAQWLEKLSIDREKLSVKGCGFELD